jgi:hypothetical protein
MATLTYTGFALVAKTAFTPNGMSQKFKGYVALLLTIWLGYITIASLAGVFAYSGMPPRIPLGLIVPAFSFIGWFFVSGRFKNFIAAMPASWLVYSQFFRVAVELLLFGLFTQGVLPVSATFEGYNYEIVIGITAPVVGYLCITKRILPAWVLLLWNIAGLCTLAAIVFIIISHAYLPALWTDGKVKIEELGTFPYTLLPGFLMPLAVFMHIFSIVKSKRYTT